MSRQVPSILHRYAGSKGQACRRAVLSCAALVLAVCPMSGAFAADGSAAAACNQVDVSRVTRVVRQCQACHTVEKGEAHSTGPNLHRVLGRAVGKVASYHFSPDLKNSRLRWDEPTLRRFIENPQSVFPGTRMAFGGLQSAADRDALVCYFGQQGK
jgi:cytochrome c